MNRLFASAFNLSCACVLLLSSIGLAAAPEAKPLLVPAASVKIPGAKGGFDFIQVDLPNRRLLACHTKEGTLDLVDLDKTTLIARIPVGAAQDVAVDAKSGKYFVTVSDKKHVAVIDTKTFAVKNTIATEGELDGILLDPKNRRIYAAHDHGHEVWVIDIDEEKIVATVAIPGDPEVFTYDAKNDRIYLNIVPTNEAVVIDPKTETVVDHWSVQPAQRPHGLVLDARVGRLFSAGANGELVALDTATGKVLGSAKTGNRVDQIAIDPELNKIYAASDGNVTVLKEIETGLETLGDVAVPKGGKNVAVDLKTHAVWMAFTDGKDSFISAWRAP